MKKFFLMSSVRFSIYFVVACAFNHFFHTGFILGLCLASVGDRELEWLMGKAFK